MHVVPTYSSWLNQVAMWFNLITPKAIRRGTLRSVKDLIEKVERFIARHNARSTPFVWTATADSILAKIKRLCESFPGTGS